jgi:hypothetical protein
MEENGHLSHPYSSPPLRKRAQSDQCTGSWVNLLARLDAANKERSRFPCRESTSTLQFEASLHTDWAIRAGLNERKCRIWWNKMWNETRNSRKMLGVLLPHPPLTSQWLPSEWVQREALQITVCKGRTCALSHYLLVATCHTVTVETKGQ